MFEKYKIKKDIRSILNEITELESKRARSQSALVTAILEHTDPDDEDVEFFNKYTMQINSKRDQLKIKESELKKL